MLIGCIAGCQNFKPDFMKPAQIQIPLKTNPAELKKVDVQDLKVTVNGLGASVKHRVEQALKEHFDMVYPVQGYEQPYHLECHIESSRSIPLEQFLEKQDQVSIKFTLKKIYPKVTARTVGFNYYLDEKNPTTLQDCLNGWINEFINTLYPPRTIATINLFKGKHKFDKKGRQEVKKGNNELALQYFLKAIDATPKDPHSLYNAGLMCELLGQPHRAQGFYQRSQDIEYSIDVELAIDRVGKKQY